MSLREQLASVAAPGTAYVGPNERLYSAATVNKAVIDSHGGKYSSRPQFECRGANGNGLTLKYHQRGSMQPEDTVATNTRLVCKCLSVF